MSADVALRWGYHLSDLDQLTRTAIRTAPTSAGDWHDRYADAWTAIATALYAADTPPARQDLVDAGRRAIATTTRQAMRTWGYRGDRWESGLGSAPRWALYWLQPRVTGSPEDAVVERLTLPHLLAAMTPGQRAAIAALAAHDGDRRAAAEALGMAEPALRFQVRAGRRRAMAVWLDGETPARRRGAWLDRSRRHAA